MFITMEQTVVYMLYFSNENIINVFHNELELCNTELDLSHRGSEGRMYDVFGAFGLKIAGSYTVHTRCDL